MLVLSTDDGQVVVDSGAPRPARRCVAALDELPRRARATLFNTHWHLDQVGSNETLARRARTIVAHEKTRQRLADGYYLPTEDRYQKPLPKRRGRRRRSTRPATRDRRRRQIEYGYLLEAHTDGDIYVLFP